MYGLSRFSPLHWRGLSNVREAGGYTQDYFTNKVYSVGKSCAPRDVTQGNPLRPSAWGFKMRYFPNIYGDFFAFNYFPQDNKA